MWKLKLSLNEAFKQVKQRRFIMPNSGFIAQLKQFEKRLNSEVIDENKTLNSGV